MSQKPKNHFRRTAEDLETNLEVIYGSPLPITYRLTLRQPVDGLWLSSNENGEPTYDTSAIEDTIAALRRLKANLKRRVTSRASLTTERLMEIPDDAR